MLSEWPRWQVLRGGLGSVKFARYSPILITNVHLEISIHPVGRLWVRTMCGSGWQLISSIPLLFNGPAVFSAIGLSAETYVTWASVRTYYIDKV